MHYKRFYGAVRGDFLDRQISSVLTRYKIPKTLFLVNRMKKAYVNDDWNPDEYILFHYEDLSPKARHAFVMQNEGSRFRHMVNTPTIHNLFLDKSITYNYFKDFYRRELVKITEKENQISAFSAFVNEYDNIVIKSLKEAGGEGVKMMQTRNEKGCVDVLYENLWKEYPEGFLLEERIIQSPDLAIFHPASVNTVRLTTYKYDGKVELIHRPFIRFGQGDAIVDNGAKGGIIASIDFETGIITSAIDELGKHYIVHPDSGKTILGFHIPYWKEAKEMALTLMNIIPDAKYIGWDLALTNEGWVMVEGNSRGLFIGFQLPNQMGWREEYEEIKEKMRIKCK